MTSEAHNLTSRSHKRLTRSPEDLRARVFSATISLILSQGIRKLRTADIAKLAKTTESTLFRHFESLDNLLTETYNHCWALINEVISRSGFERPRLSNPEEVLLADTAALWSMKSDKALGEAATVAFLFLRRRAEMVPDLTDRAEEQQRFERRLAGLCEQILESRDNAKSEQKLVQLISNYCATVWLTWFCMPVDNDDVTAAEHDLSLDEAQLGILVILDRFTAPSAVDGTFGSQHMGR